MPDRERVIKALRCCVNEPYVDCTKCDYYDGRWDCVKRICNDALELLKEQEWHMLTEDDDGIIHGLPGDDGQYLMTDGKDIWIDEYVDGVDDGIILDSGRDIREIMAWMYMPELPKTERRRSGNDSQRRSYAEDVRRSFRPLSVVLPSDRVSVQQEILQMRIVREYMLRGNGLEKERTRVRDDESGSRYAAVGSGGGSAEA